MTVKYKDELYFILEIHFKQFFSCFYNRFQRMLKTTKEGGKLSNIVYLSEKEEWKQDEQDERDKIKVFFAFLYKEENAGSEW